jgi:RNAse (barnase) inhibitor barstar
MEKECAYQAIMSMIEEMKKDIAKTQKILYPEQIKVAEIYYVVAKTLAKACRKAFGKKLSHCTAPDNLKANVTLDCFILLKQLREDKFISEEYAEKIFNALLEMKPELREKVLEDRAKGLL